MNIKNKKDLILTSREKDLIKSAISICEDKDKAYYKALKDEFEVIENKLSCWINQVGNVIKSSFIMDSDGNQALNEREALLNKGYEPFYYSACYHWGLINKEKLRIVTYTEGDINYIYCESVEKFNKEVTESIKFFIEQGEGTIDNKNGFFDLNINKYLVRK